VHPLAELACGERARAPVPPGPDEPLALPVATWKHGLGCASCPRPKARPTIPAGSAPPLSSHRQTLLTLQTLQTLQALLTQLTQPIRPAPLILLTLPTLLCPTYAPGAGRRPRWSPVSY
jgi:hypothetical protein